MTDVPAASERRPSGAASCASLRSGGAQGCSETGDARAEVRRLHARLGECRTVQASASPQLGHRRPLQAEPQAAAKPRSVRPHHVHHRLRRPGAERSSKSPLAVVQRKEQRVVRRQIAVAGIHAYSSSGGKQRRARVRRNAPRHRGAVIARRGPGNRDDSAGTAPGHRDKEPRGADAAGIPVVRVSRAQPAPRAARCSMIGRSRCASAAGTRRRPPPTRPPPASRPARPTASSTAARQCRGCSPSTKSPRPRPK